MSRMNEVTWISVAVCLGLLLIGCAMPLFGQQTAAASSAVVPPLVSFSGVLSDAHNNPLTGVVGVTFAFYKESQGGVPLWLEMQNVYPDKTGRYTVLLGSTTSTGLPSDLFVSGEARWLGVQVQGQAEQPRVSLLSVPYALKAGDAQTVGGLPPSAFVLAAPPVSSSAGTTITNSTMQPLATGTTPVTTAGGTINVLAKWDAAADITNSQIFDNGTNVGIGTSAPAAKLDVKGTAAVRGLFVLPAIGAATATTGYTSQPLKLTASVFNSGTGTAVAQNFQLQAEPIGNNTSTTSGTLDLLYSAGTNKVAETGLKVASNGQITFAAGQTFPGTGTGNGSVTSIGLTAPSTEFVVTGSPVTTSGTLGLGWIAAPDFNNTPNAIVKRDSSGNFSAGTINAASGFNLGGSPFDFGSFANGNAFLGFAGNTSTTGGYNTAAGINALATNTTGSYDTAVGAYANVGANNLTNATAIGARAQVTQSNSLVLGSINGVNGATASTNVGIGTTAPTQSLEVDFGNAMVKGLGNFKKTGDTAFFYIGDTNHPIEALYGSGLAIGTYKVPQALFMQDQTGRVGVGTTTPAYTLDVNGTGNFTGQVNFASGQTFPGTGSVTSVGLTAPSTDFIVTGSPVSTSGTLGLGWLTAPDFNNTPNAIVKRDSSGNFSAGTINAASGFNLGGYPFAFGSYNYQNAFFGFAGNTTTTGSLNTASGWWAFLYNTTGQENTAIGEGALQANTTGSYNSASSAMALTSNISGNSNTAGGYYSMRSNTTGSSNTAVGYMADVIYGNLTNATAIGANALVGESNALVLGCINHINNCPGVSVGIGTATPAYTLDVQGSGRFTQPITFASSQTFPGAGTITGVSPGTDLMGGGNSGNVTLSLDTTKLPQLGGGNTFSGSQTINGSLTISTTANAVTASGAIGVTGTGTSYGVFGYGGPYGVYGTGSSYGVSGTSNGYGVYGSGGSYGVYGTSSTAVGVEGDSYSASGYGVRGSNTQGTGVYGTSAVTTGYGVRGDNNTGGGTGVYGGNTNANGGTGVYGTSSSVNGRGVLGNNTAGGDGVYGSGGVGVSGSGSADGVLGESSSATGYGVQGSAPLATGVWGDGSTGVYATGGNYGVYADSTGFAGYFYGPVNVVGYLYKSGGGFKIDHPLDPANKYLYHSFVESPDMKNVYDGMAILDDKGEAWVSLPEWFEVINREFRYQLTAVGAPGPNLYVSQEIANNRFQIAGGTPGGKVSWQVTGIRQDAYAKAHPILPEVEKIGDEKGKYLHPVEHGQPKSMGIDESRMKAHAR